MPAIQPPSYGAPRTWRLLLWGTLVSLLVAPLVAMQFTDEVRWGIEDLASATLLLGGVGIAVELAQVAFRSARARMVAIAAALALALLIWADAAVGVF